MLVLIVERVMNFLKYFFNDTISFLLKILIETYDLVINCNIFPANCIAACNFNHSLNCSDHDDLTFTSNQCNCVI